MEWTLMAVLVMLACMSVAWALVPQSSAVRFSGAGLATAGAGKAGPLAGLAARIGRLMPARVAGAVALQDLVFAGSTLTVQQLAGLKVLGAALGLGIAVILGREFAHLGPIAWAVAAAAGYLLPGLWVKSRLARRRRAIVRLLPEVFDLLSVCISAGLDFLGALHKVVVLPELQKEPLIEELGVVVQEIKLGKRRGDALRAMAKRVQMPEISSFVRTLVQADRMGTPIASVLAVHSEDVRDQRFVRAERAALRAPIKLLFPLICCIMPCVAIIVGAPVLIQFVRYSPFGK